jgi:hypothetical protein
LAYGCPGVLPWKPTRSMDWSCISRRQHLNMTTPVTEPDSVWFLPLGFRQRQCLLPPHVQRRFRNCEDVSAMPSRMSQKTCLRGFGRMGVLLGHQSCHTWCAHQMHLR